MAAGTKREVVLLLLAAVVTAGVIYGLSCTGYTFLNRQITTNEIENEQCFSGENGEDAPAFCAEEGVTFDKFIWFVTDGFPAKNSESLFAKYDDHSIIYHVRIPGAKYSHAIYTSWLTGQLPTNYNGKPIVGDNLLAAMKRSKAADYKLHYSGPEWSFLAITGSDNYEEYFDRIDINYESIDIHYKHAYPFFFETETERTEFEWEFMPELLRQNRSLIAHSAIFDHAQHGVFRGHGDPRMLNPWARTITTDMAWMKTFIDNHPEYLLIMSSDHGVDEYLMSGYVLHGSSDNGNNGYLMMYNPRLPKGQHVQGIDIVDVCPTLAKHFKGVDIPMNSLGNVKSYFGTSQPRQFVNAMKQNINQLQENVRLRGLPIDTTEAKELLEMGVDQESVSKLHKYADLLKQRLYTTVIAPYELVAAYSLISISLYIFLYTTLDRATLPAGKKSIWMRIVGFVVSPTKAKWFLIATFPVSVNLLVGWSLFGKVFRSGTTFFLGTPMLAISILYNLSELGGLQKGTYRASISRLFKNEVTNWFILTLTLCIKENWKIAVREMPFNWAITYALGYWVLQYSVRVYYEQLDKYASKKDAVFSGSSPSPQSSGWERRLPLIVMSLCLLFELTESNLSLYCLAGFHVVYAAVIFGGALYLLVLLARGRLGPGSVIMAGNVILWVLWMDSSAARLMLMLINVQYLVFLCPLLMELDRARQALTASPSENSSGFLPEGVSERWRVENAFQLALLYFINQMYCHFSVALSDRINLSVQPFAGKIGVSGFDLYPVLSGFFMGYHKYGWFGLMGYYAWYCVTRTGSDTTKLSSSGSVCSRWVTKLGLTGEARRRVEFLMSFLLYFVNAQLGFAIMLCFYGSGHAIEEAVVYCALTGLIAVGFAVFCLLYALGHLIYGSTPPEELHRD